MSFVIAAGVLVFITLSGYGLIRTFVKDDLPFSAFGIIPLSFGAGLAAIAVLGDLIMLCGLRLSFFTMYAPMLFLFVFGLSRIDAAKAFDLKSFTAKLNGLSKTEWMLIFVIAFSIITLVVLCFIFPLSFWDSRAIWGTKAKMLFYSRTVFSSDFMDPFRLNPHPRYPLLFPMSESFVYFAIGTPDDYAIMVLIAAFFPMLLSFLFDLARVLTRDRLKVWPPRR